MSKNKALGYLIGLFLGGGLILSSPILANATILQQQTTVSGATSPVRNQWIQQIGTGLVGTINSVAWYVSDLGTAIAADDAIIAQIEYTGSNYSGITGACSMFAQVGYAQHYSGWIIASGYQGSHASCVINSARYEAIAFDPDASSVGGITTGNTLTYDGANPVVLTNVDAVIKTGAYIVSTDDVPPLPPTDTTTRFISVTPTASTTVATSTTIGAEVYINANDFVDGMYLDMAFTNQTVANVGGSALDAFNAAFGGAGNGGTPIQFPLVSGDNVISTSTIFNVIGVTDGVYRVVSPTWYSNLWLIGSLFQGNTIIASSTRFVVVQPTGLDIALSQGGQSLVSALLTGTTTMPVINCDVRGFNLENCLISLIVPPSSVLKADLDELRSKSPFGWLYRIVSLMGGSATTTLPVLSYTFQSDSPLSGQVYSFDTNQYMTQAAALVTEAKSNISGNQKTVWDILEPVVDLFIYLVLLFAMLHDISGIRLTNHKR